MDGRQVDRKMTPTDFALQSADMEMRGSLDYGFAGIGWVNVPDTEAGRVSDEQLAAEIRELAKTHQADYAPLPAQPRTRIGRIVGRFISRHS